MGADGSISGGSSGGVTVGSGASAVSSSSAVSLRYGASTSVGSSAVTFGSVGSSGAWAGRCRCECKFSLSAAIHQFATTSAVRSMPFGLGLTGPVVEVLPTADSTCHDCNT